MLCACIQLANISALLTAGGRAFRRPPEGFKAAEANKEFDPFGFIKDPEGGPPHWLSGDGATPLVFLFNVLDPA